jgi:single-strand DNA-binding protein
MANGVNKVILLGNLGKDPEVHNFENGVKKVSFSLATTETFKNKEGLKVQQTEWHNIVIWRNFAEAAEKYLHKGDTVYIEGKLKTREYEVNGVKKYITEVLADSMTMVATRRETSASPVPPVQEQPTVQEQTVEYNPPIAEPSDDLPF